MKKLILLISAVIIMASCTAGKQQEDTHEAWTYGTTLYEMNVRQLTPEGTFEAAAEQLPRLKDNGVDIIWIMPMFPIGVKERKGTLGSYYSVRDCFRFWLDRGVDGFRCDVAGEMPVDYWEEHISAIRTRMRYMCSSTIMHHLVPFHGRIIQNLHYLCLKGNG